VTALADPSCTKRNKSHMLENEESAVDGEVPQYQAMYKTVLWSSTLSLQLLVFLDASDELTPTDH
jgi:hypothetical protein